MVNERIKFIDFARVLAIICVLICHCTESFYKYTPDFMTGVSFLSKVFACSMFTFGRIGVPLFLMITGYLILDRVYDGKATLRFWNRNVKHLIICSLFWAFVCELFLIFVSHDSISIVDFILSVLFLKPINISHFWYLPMIIGMYILIPFVASALRNFDEKVIIKPVIFFSVLAFLVPFIISILKIYGIGDLSLGISLGFSGGVYGIYIVLGYLVKKDYFKKFKSKLLILVFLISFFSFIILEIFYFNQGFKLHIYYESPFVFVCSVCLFELITRIKEVKFHNILKPMAIYAFGVYVVHQFIRNIFIPLIQGWIIPTPIKVFALLFIVFGLSYILVIIISKIPKIGKYILYLK